MNTDNTTTAIQSVDNDFSWQRVDMIARYYYPSIRRQLIIYPAISVAVGIATFFMYNSPLSTIFAGILSMVLSFMFYFGPIVFTRRSDRAIETMLPATTGEKATFLLLYSFIVIPLLVYLPQFLVQRILIWTMPSNDFFMTINDLTSKFIGKTFGLSVAQSLVPLATCLYVVMRVKSNRAILGMVWAVASLIVTGICSAIYGVYFALHSEAFRTAAFESGYNDATAGLPPKTAQELGGEIASSMVDYMMPFMITMGILSLIYVIVMAYLTARTIKKGQY